MKSLGGGSRRGSTMSQGQQARRPSNLNKSAPGDRSPVPGQIPSKSVPASLMPSRRTSVAHDSSDFISPKGAGGSRRGSAVSTMSIVEDRHNTRIVHDGLSPGWSTGGINKIPSVMSHIGSNSSMNAGGHYSNKSRQQSRGSEGSGDGADLVQMIFEMRSEMQNLHSRIEDWNEEVERANEELKELFLTTSRQNNSKGGNNGSSRSERKSSAERSIPGSAYGSSGSAIPVVIPVATYSSTSSAACSLPMSAQISVNAPMQAEMSMTAVSSLAESPAVHRPIPMLPLQIHPPKAHPPAWAPSDVEQVLEDASMDLEGMINAKRNTMTRQSQAMGNVLPGDESYENFEDDHDDMQIAEVDQGTFNDEIVNDCRSHGNLGLAIPAPPTASRISFQGCDSLTKSEGTDDADDDSIDDLPGHYYSEDTVGSYNPDNQERSPPKKSQSRVSMACSQNDSVRTSLISVIQERSERDDIDEHRFFIDECWRGAFGEAGSSVGVFAYQSNGSSTGLGARKIGSQSSADSSMSHQSHHTIVQHFDFEERTYLGVLTPGGHKRLIWDCLAAVVIAFEAIATPFIICFDPPEKAFIVSTTLLSLTFWFFDLVLNFFTGFHADGEVVMERFAIAIRYCKTWLGVDAILLFCDIMMIFFAFNNADQVGPAVRVVRLGRVVRLLRLVKMKWVVNEINNKLSSEYLTIMFAILFRIGAILLVTHLMACGWYLVGTTKFENGYLVEKAGTAHETTWVQAAGFANHPLIDKYMVSYHWAIAQIHGDMEQVFPQNRRERSYAIVVLLLALFTFTVFIGEFASLLGSLWSGQVFKDRQFWLLRQYLKQMNVTDLCAAKVEAYLQHVVVKRQKEISADSVEILKYLSKPLKDELKAESYSVCLEKHTFFLYIDHQQDHGVIKLVDAFSTLWMSSRDMLFTSGDHLKGMIFLIDGDSSYTWIGSQKKDPRASRKSLRKSVTGGDAARKSIMSSSRQSIMSTSMLMEDDGERVPAGQWVSEAVIWLTDWVALGDLAVRETCQVVYINADIFKQRARNHAGLIEIMRAYGCSFVKDLNAVAQKDLTDLMHVNFSPDMILIEAELVTPDILAQLHGLEVNNQRGSNNVWGRSASIGGKKAKLKRGCSSTLDHMIS